MMNSKCNLCPRRCNAKRYNGQIGMCKCGNKIKTIQIIVE